METNTKEYLDSVAGAVFLVLNSDLAIGVELILR